MTTTRKQIIELLSMDYSEVEIIQVIDTLIQQQNLRPSELPDNFAEQVITSFEIAEEGKNKLPAGEASSMLPLSPDNLQKAESLGIPSSMLQITAQVVLGKIDAQFDNLFAAAGELISQKISAGCNQLAQSTLNSALDYEVVTPEKILQVSGIKSPEIQENTAALQEYLQSLNIDCNSGNLAEISEKLYQHHASK